MNITEMFTLSTILHPLPIFILLLLNLIFGITCQIAANFIYPVQNLLLLVVCFGVYDDENVFLFCSVVSETGDHFHCGV